MASKTLTRGKDRAASLDLTLDPCCCLNIRYPTRLVEKREVKLRNLEHQELFAFF